MTGTFDMSAGVFLAVLQATQQMGTEAEQLFAATSAGCNGREEGALEELRALMESEAAAVVAANHEASRSASAAAAAAGRPAPSSTTHPPTWPAVTRVPPASRSGPLT